MSIIDRVRKFSKFFLFGTVFIISLALFIISITMIIPMFIIDLTLQCVVRPFYLTISFVSRYSKQIKQIAEPITAETTNDILYPKTHLGKYELMDLFLDILTDVQFKDREESLLATGLKVKGETNQIKFIKNIFLSPFVFICYALTGLVSNVINIIKFIQTMYTISISFSRKMLEFAELKQAVPGQSKYEKEIYEVIGSFRNRSAIVLRTITSCLSKKNKLEMQKKVIIKLTPILKPLLKKYNKSNSQKIDDFRKESANMPFSTDDVIMKIMFSAEGIKNLSAKTSVQEMSLRICQQFNIPIWHFVRRDFDSYQISYNSLYEEYRPAEQLSLPKPDDEDIRNLHSLILPALQRNNALVYQYFLFCLTENVDSLNLDCDSITEHLVKNCLNSRGLASCMTLSAVQIRSNLESLFDFDYEINVLLRIQRAINDIIQNRRFLSHKKKLDNLKKELKERNDERIEKNKHSVYDEPLVSDIEAIEELFRAEGKYTTKELLRDKGESETFIDADTIERIPLTSTIRKYGCFEC